MPARGFLAVEVEDHVIHLLADGGIIGQHLVTEARGRAVRKFLLYATEKFVRKQVDDMIFDFYGEETPCRQEEHEPRLEQGMTFGGM